MEVATETQEFGMVKRNVYKSLTEMYVCLKRSLMFEENITKIITLIVRSLKTEKEDSEDALVFPKSGLCQMF